LYAVTVVLSFIKEEKEKRRKEKKIKIKNKKIK